MADEQVPADWVLLEAARQSGWCVIARNVEPLRGRYSIDSTFRALCDMIAKYEKPPVDEATELFAAILDAWVNPHAARRIRACDDLDGQDQAAIAVIRDHLAKVRAETHPS